MGKLLIGFGVVRGAGRSMSFRRSQWVRRRTDGFLPRGYCGVYAGPSQPDAEFEMQGGCL